MGVSSYFEFITTLLGWIIYENIYDVLSATGIVFIPFIGIIVNHVIQSRKAGDDEGSAAVQSVKRIETDILVTLFTLLVVVIPVSDVSLSEMRYVRPALNCKLQAEEINGTNTETTTDYALDTLGGESGKAPVWWAIMHMLSKSVTSAAIAGIPCSYDIASIEINIANETIKDPSVRRELQQFIQDCYRPAYASYVYDGANGVTVDEQGDVKWLGSKYLVDNYYSKFYASKARKDFPFNAARDAGFEGDAKTGGHPFCNEWWVSGNGLRSKLLGSFDGDLMNDYVYDADNLISVLSRQSFGRTEREDIFLRKYLDMHEVGRSSMRSAVSYDLTRDEIIKKSATDSGSLLGNAISGGVSTVFELGKEVFAGGSATIGAVISAPSHIVEAKAIRESVPFAQGLVLLMFVALLPFLLVFSSYKLQTVVTLTVIYFSFHFLSFIWALAFWLDNNLTSMMIQGRGLIGVWDVGSNPMQVVTLIWMQKFLYIVLPTVWTIMLGWIGFQSGSAFSDMSSVSNAGVAPAKAGAETLKGAAAKGAKG